MSPRVSMKWSEVTVLSRVLLFATPWTVAYQVLFCPWDFPGNSPGVDCHFLLQRIFPTQGSNPGLSHCRQTLYWMGHQGSLLAQSCPTLCNPMDCSLPGSSIRWIFQARVLEWVAVSFSMRHHRTYQKNQRELVCNKIFLFQEPCETNCLDECQRMQSWYCVLCSKIHVIVAQQY